MRELKRRQHLKRRRVRPTEEKEKAEAKGVHRGGGNVFLIDSVRKGEPPGKEEGGGNVSQLRSNRPQSPINMKKEETGWGEKGKRGGVGGLIKCKRLQTDSPRKTNVRGTGGGEGGPGKGTGTENLKRRRSAREPTGGKNRGVRKPRF